MTFLYTHKIEVVFYWCFFE